MKRSEITSNIRKMSLRTKDYDTLYNLYQNTSANLFTRILEGIFEGSVIISDFELMFSNKMKDGIEQSIISQAAIEEHFIRYTTFREVVAARSGGTFDNLVGVIEGAQYDTTVINERLDRIVDFMSNTDVDSLSDIIMSNVYETMLTNDEFAESIILSRTKLIIPLDFKDMIVTDYDRNFMFINNLTEDEMKKMKALAYLVYFKKGNNLTNEDNS